MTSSYKPKEACGVVGVVSAKPVAAQLYYALRALQHRGQESAGIAVFNEELHTVKGPGLVHEVFRNKKISSIKGSLGIGHNRYSTAGKNQDKNVQPLTVNTTAGKIALAHNGDIVNAETLRNDMTAKGYTFQSDADTEVIAHVIALELAQNGNNMLGAIKATMRQLVGSYSIVILTENALFCVRDPLGIKPLCLGTVEGGHIVASESVAIDILEGALIRDIAPGEILELRDERYFSHRGLRAKNSAHCMFEYVYFARPDSIIDGRVVYDVREKLGEKLADELPADADVVCPIPDSGTSYALGFSRASGIPFAEGLIKNRYAWRTFILPNQQMRITGVREKLNPVKSIISGKKVILVDDSIVRGTTMRRIVQMVRNVGAEEVHVRIGSPPVKAPCYLGIDMHTREQFIAAEKTLPEIAKEITADSIAYISVEGLVEALGHKKEDLCLGCLDGFYPVEIPGEKMRFQQRLVDYE